VEIKTLRADYSGEEMIYNALPLHNDKEKNKGLLIPLKRATARVTKGAGESEQQENIQKPGK
jgi:hypothetical protein